MKGGRSFRGLCLLAACAVSALVALHARADVGVGIGWDAPTACPSETALRSQIDELLGGPAEQRVRGQLTVRAVVVRGERWTVTLDTTSGSSSGHRSIEAATCDALASATALIVALMIDPAAVAARAVSAKPEAPELKAAPPAVAAPPSASAPTPRSTRALASVGAVAHVGVLPAADAGPALGLGLLHGLWRGELRVAYSPRAVSSEALADPQGGYARFRFFAAALAGCRMIAWTHLELGGCAEGELGAVWGQGYGGTTNTTKTTPWAGLGVGGLVVLRVTRWLELPLRLGAVAPLWRPDYVFQGGQPSAIFRSAPVGGRLSLAAEARF